MIRKILNFFISFINEIYVFESKRNKKNIKLKNFLLKKYTSLKQIKDYKIIHHLKKMKTILDLKKNKFY